MNCIKCLFPSNVFLNTPINEDAEIEKVNNAISFLTGYHIIDVNNFSYITGDFNRKSDCLPDLIKGIEEGQCYVEIGVRNGDDSNLKIWITDLIAKRVLKEKNNAGYKYEILLPKTKWTHMFIRNKCPLVIYK